MSLSCFCSKCGGDEIFVGRSLFQLSCTFQDILEKIETALLKDQVALPRILIIIPGHDGRDSIQICLGKLGLNDLCDLLRRMSLDIIHALLERIGKALDNIRIFVDIAFLCAESSVGNVSAVLAQGSDDVAFALRLKRSRAGFKLDSKL